MINLSIVLASDLNFIVTTAIAAQLWFFIYNSDSWCHLWFSDGWFAPLYQKTTKFATPCCEAFEFISAIMQGNLEISVEFDL